MVLAFKKENIKYSLLWFCFLNAGKKIPSCCMNCFLLGYSWYFIPTLLYKPTQMECHHTSILATLPRLPIIWKHSPSPALWTISPSKSYFGDLETPLTLTNFLRLTPSFQRTTPLCTTAGHLCPGKVISQSYVWFYTIIFGSAIISLYINAACLTC